MKHSQASLCVVASLFVTFAFAQDAQGLVKVDLGTVANTVAKNINVDVEKIPATVQLPVGVAAGTCGVPAAKLAAMANGETASCQATATSPALERLVQAQVKGEPKE